jgi:hypothetical protein
VRRLSLALLFLASAAAATCLLHSRTLGYGFDYDDYHFVRPYSRAEIAAAFQGPWDASGIELPYYRPLTIAFFAARFELLGVNAAGHHGLSLVLFAAFVFLTAWFAYRLSARAAGAFLVLLFLAAHPATPYSLVAWITNQMHLLQALIVLLAFCWWDGVRRRSAGWWMPLLLLAVAAFLVKEDGVMLLPCVAVLHETRRRFVEHDLPRMPRTFAVLALLAIVALLFVRGEALAGATSRRVPTAAVAVGNYVAGLQRVFCLAPADRPWQGVASWFAMALPLTALLVWRRAAAGSRALLVSGACIALLFNLPFVFVTKAEQLHLVALGAGLVLAASVLSLLDAARSAAARMAVIAGAAAGIAVFAVVTLDITRDFEPFGAIVLSHDDIVRGWAAVPAEIRAYLASKREPGSGPRVSSNPAAALDRITFGTHGTETGRDGVSYRWMSGCRTDILVAPHVRTVTIPLRHAIEVFRDPVHVTIRVDGRTVDRMELTTPDWRVSQAPVGLLHVPWLGGMHRVAIRIDRTWKPSDVIPGSTDGRVLGLQIGEIDTQPRRSAMTAGARR